jgi:hypothetical protein
MSTKITKKRALEFLFQVAVQFNCAVAVGGLTPELAELKKLLFKAMNVLKPGGNCRGGMPVNAEGITALNRVIKWMINHPIWFSWQLIERATNLSTEV